MNVLISGAALESGQQLTSVDGGFVLTMQGDGNLVLSTSGGRPVWASGTAATGAVKAIMQLDGNLVLYDDAGKPLWATNTAGNPGSSLTLEGEPNLVIYSGTTPLWTMHTLNTGAALGVGQQLTSVFAGYYLTLQGDGNLVLYAAAGTPVWASDTAGSGAVKAIMQLDGNLVLYDETGRPVWATNTDGNDGAHASLQTNGSLALYSNDIPAIPLWTSRAVTLWPAAQDTWAIVLCDFSDQQAAPWFVGSRQGAAVWQGDAGFFRELFVTGRGGVSDYFRAISYGKRDLSPSQVFGWITLPYTYATADAQPPQQQVQYYGDAVSQAGLTPAADGHYTDASGTEYDQAIVVWNLPFLYGGSPGMTNLAPDPSFSTGSAEPSVAGSCHEMLHAMGLREHSFDDQERVGNTGAPGEYGDQWDVMSVAAAYSFRGLDGLWSGPELNAPYRQKWGVMPLERVVTVTPDGSKSRSSSIFLAALNRPDVYGPFMVQVPIADGIPGHYFSVELRQRSGFDVGLPHDAVLVHDVKPASWSAQHTEYEVSPETEPVVVAYGQLDDVSEQNLRIVVFLPVISGSATGKLMIRSWDGSTWSWFDGGKAIVGQPAVLLRGNTASPDPSGIRINLFVQGADGELWEYFFDGGQWSWTDTGRQVIGDPRVIAWGDQADLTAANLRVHVYCQDSSGELWIRSWDGSNWSWFDTGKAIVGQPAVLLRGNTASPDASGIRINLFARGADGELWEYFFDGGQWSWSDTGRQVIGDPRVIAWGDQADLTAANLRVHVYCQDSSGQLIIRSWDGSSWSWAATGKAIVGQPAVLLRGNTASPDASGIRINLFAQGADGELWEYFFDGGQWSWSDTGRQVIGNPRVIAWGDQADLTAASLWIHVYSRIAGSDSVSGDTSGELWIRSWDGATWQWSNADRVMEPHGNAVPLLVGDSRSHNLLDVRLHLFAVSIGRHLWERYWDGSTWYGRRVDSSWEPSLALVSYLQKRRDPEFDGGFTAGMTYSHELFTVAVDQIYPAETDPWGSTSAITITY
jgi:hypothetical protein